MSTNQFAPDGSTLTYPRKMTRPIFGGQLPNQTDRIEVLNVGDALAQVQAERAGFTDAAGENLLKQTFPRTMKNLAGNILVASCQAAYLQLLNDGYSDAASSLA